MRRCTAPAQLAHRHIRHSLVGGFYQGWDLHPAQLPVRCATCFAFFLEELCAGVSVQELRREAARAGHAGWGDVFDEHLPEQGCSVCFCALNCGAIDLDDRHRMG